MSLIDFSVTTREPRANKLEPGDPLDVYGTTRRCNADGCQSLLSRYNPTTTCGAHRGWREAPTRRRKA